jgi:hypothetical protein
MTLTSLSGEEQADHAGHRDARDSDDPFTAVSIQFNALIEGAITQ